MKTIRKSMTSKAVAVVVALATAAFMMGMTSFAATTHAASNADLQAQIESLLAEIASLQAQISGENSGATSSCVGSDFLHTSMGVGHTGPAVMQLQEFLNAQGFTVADTGAGSVGAETMYYGSLTANAVSRFQLHYADTVLAGLAGPTGYWGTRSATQASELCASSSNEGNNDNEGNNGNETADLEGGEAALEDYDISSGNDSDITEGDSGEVAEAEFDVEDADVMVDRVDVSFAHADDVTGQDDEPWDVFETVSIWVDGDEVASVDASDEEEWLDDDTDKPVAIRLSDLDWMVEEGDTANFTVAVEVQDGVDGVNSGNVEWDVSVEEDGIRAVDGLDIQHRIGDNADSVSFDIEEEGENEDLDLSTSGDNPDESTIAVDDSNESDTYAITVGELEAEDGDFEVNDVTTQFVVYSATSSTSAVEYDDVVSDLWLEIGDETFDSDSVTLVASTTDVDGDGGADLVYDVTFDVDGDAVVEAGEEANISVLAEFRGTDSGYNSGQDVSADITRVEAEASEDVPLTDEVEGEIQTLSAFAIDANQTDSNNSEKVESLSIKVTADDEGEDVFIPLGKDTNGDGVFDEGSADAMVVDGSENVHDGFVYTITYGTTSSMKITNSDELDIVEKTKGVSDYFYARINDGDTEQFDLQFVFNSDASTDDDGHVVVEAIQYTDAENNGNTDDQNPVLQLDEGIDFEA